MKAAFLWDKSIEKDTLINPPNKVSEDNTVWQLEACVYGLNDVSPPGIWEFMTNWSI